MTKERINEIRKMIEKLGTFFPYETDVPRSYIYRFMDQAPFIIRELINEVESLKKVLELKA